jgi:membrane protein implicated in regulation of membrane protease activity
MHLSLAWTLAIYIPVNIVSFFISGYAMRNPDFGYYWFGAWVLWCAGWAGLDLAGGRWIAFGLDIVFGAVFFWYWWNCRKRRKRKRATELAGYKAKAIAEKMAARQRETAQRRPVLSPLPDQQ